MATRYELGTVEASETLIYDLYISLRQRVRAWAAVTNQTAQARMGYIGQHLASVVTGLSGGRSGARGKDLLLPDGGFAEIKTCYRVDQLGKCNSCHAVVASIEEECPKCGSKDLQRNDDSKWLIGIRNEDEFRRILDPQFYVLVLFDFIDLATPDTIRASIWRVETKIPGFAYCVIDYRLNIQAKSASKAPFNLWPYQLKFDLMRPLLIYRSLIRKDDRVETLVFPGRDKPEHNGLKPLPTYTRSTNLTTEKTRLFAEILGVRHGRSDTKNDLLRRIQDLIDRETFDLNFVIDALAYALYMPDIKLRLPKLPSDLLSKLPVMTQDGSSLPKIRRTQPAVARPGDG